MFRTASSLLASAAARLRTLPGLQGLVEGAAALGLFGLTAFAIHTLMSPIHFSMGLPGLRNDPDAFLRVAAIALLIPALGEELVFRGILQPARMSTTKDFAVSALSLAAFVLWHPVQVWLGLPMAQPVFTEPAFLTLVAVLGALCTALTHRTGSLWPAMALHWVVVVGWKAGTG